MEENKRVIIKEELIELTGDFKKAIILNFFINKLNQSDNNWIEITLEKLSKEILILSSSTLQRHLLDLDNFGYLLSENAKGKKKKYAPDLEKIKEELLELGYNLENTNLNYLE